MDAAGVRCRDAIRRALKLLRCCLVRCCQALVPALVAAMCQRRCGEAQCRPCATTWPWLTMIKRSTDRVGRGGTPPMLHGSRVTWWHAPYAARIACDVVACPLCCTDRV